mmetsp:Transcript_21550/g.55958  ORF Transcript_21550/g.55958 Transcript_21550/m.55958 type:complete len:104 (-) Transcript_21550:56-367(-)
MATISAGVDKKTEDGFGYGVQVNYLGHYMLTEALIPLMEKSERVGAFTPTCRCTFLAVKHTYWCACVCVCPPFLLCLYSSKRHDGAAFVAICYCDCCDIKHWI